MISKIHPIPAFSDNYIWATSEQNSNKACVVDPEDAKPVVATLETNLFLHGRNTAPVKSAESKIGHAAANEIGVFAALTSWKDNF